MRILFLGPAPESRGFLLAGVASETCETASSAASALAAASRPGSEIGLVLLSASLAFGVGEGRAFRGLEAPPAVLVLPDSPSPPAPSSEGSR